MRAAVLEISIVQTDVREPRGILVSCSLREMDWCRSSGWTAITHSFPRHPLLWKFKLTGWIWASPTTVHVSTLHLFLKLFLYGRLFTLREFITTRTRRKHTINDKHFCSKFQIITFILKGTLIFLEEERYKDIKKIKNKLFIFYFQFSSSAHK
jgi:hypothetical protein